MVCKKLVLRDITHSFSTKEPHWILKDINLQCVEQESYAIVGPSGCGKSTLLHIMGGLLHPISGSVAIHDNEAIITPSSPAWHEYFGFVFQQPFLLDELSVVENVMLKGFLQGNSEDQCYEQARELLYGMDLKNLEKYHPKQLSVGQQHRVALARALFAKPTFLIADEPTAALDQKTSEIITSLLLKYAKEHKIGLIVASHDVKLINQLMFRMQLV